MDINRFAAFLAASALVLAIPGPTVLLVVSRSLNHGAAIRRATVSGVVAGDLVAMSAALLGAGAVLAASATLFTTLRIAGGVYLVWLGVRTWRARGAQWHLLAPAPADPRRVFMESFAVTATNPKSIAFFVAFVPQFVAPARPFAQQATILIATFVTMAAANAAIYALAAGRLATRIRRPSVRRWFNRAGGTMLIGAGAATALMKRA